ncbi:hypothetical protein PC123_g3973 [Phytophthora cactorum]|nr:hypothetical protein PC123_g3973 [Phytophthora cactorum]
MPRSWKDDLRIWKDQRKYIPYENLKQSIEGKVCDIQAQERYTLSKGTPETSDTKNERALVATGPPPILEMLPRDLKFRVRVSMVGNMTPGQAATCRKRYTLNILSLTNFLGSLMDAAGANREDALDNAAVTELGQLYSEYEQVYNEMDRADARCLQAVLGDMREQRKRRRKLHEEQRQLVRLQTPAPASLEAATGNQVTSAAGSHPRTRSGSSSPLPRLTKSLNWGGSEEKEEVACDDVAAEDNSSFEDNEVESSDVGSREEKIELESAESEEGAR